MPARKICRQCHGAEFLDIYTNSQNLVRNLEKLPKNVELRRRRLT